MRRKTPIGRVRQPRCYNISLEVGYNGDSNVLSAVKRRLYENIALAITFRHRTLHCANWGRSNAATGINFAAVTITPETGAAFAAALTATLKIFLMGAAGFLLVWRGLLSSKGVAGVAALTANLALPCLIIQQFAAQFDPVQFSNWWVWALAGSAIQCVQIGLSWLLSRRVKPEQGRDEMTMLLGFQNAGFFVLPMLQSLLPTAEFNRAAILLFVFIIFFNATLWPAGNRFLLKTSAFDWKSVVLAPPTFWTIIALVLFGLLHHQTLGVRETLIWHSLLGNGATPGAVTLIGNATIPLATIVLGATVAQTVRAGDFNNPRKAVEISFWKLAIWPLLGLAIIKFWPGPLFDDRVYRLLIMLEFSAPTSTTVAVFCQQHNYPMKLTPAVSLACYALCVVTVPFWIALVL